MLRIVSARATFAFLRSMCLKVSSCLGNACLLKEIENHDVTGNTRSHTNFAIRASQSHHTPGKCGKISSPGEHLSKRQEGLFANFEVFQRNVYIRPVKWSSHWEENDTLQQQLDGHHHAKR